MRVLMQSKSNRFLPQEFSRRGARLLNLQCWLWGQDINCKEGNLLLDAGFERLRPPRGESGCSQYSMFLPSGAVLKLWGFGFYCGGQQGCFLNRFDFIPRQAVLEDCWTARTFTGSPRSRSFADLPETLRWFVTYETRVIENMGQIYRNQAAIGGPDPEGAACQLAMGWTKLAKEIEVWLSAPANKQVNSPV